MTGRDPRIVLVETAASLPGLLPAASWDTLRAASVVWTRDAEADPSVPHVAAAGVDVRTLEVGPVELRGADLLAPGDPAERRLAAALIDRAVQDGDAVYLLGPADDRFARTLGGEAAKVGGLEVEFLFLTGLPRGTEVLRLVDTMRQLRAPDGGCPWDLEQDHRSLAGYLVEETYELLEAIEDGSDRDLVEELGDVLLQVVFHAQVATDRGAFGIDEVARGIADKLVRRHPHVFGEGDATTPAEVQANWDRLKADEKTDRSGPFDGVPLAQPALSLAASVQRKAAAFGFDWRDATEPADRVREELAEVAAAATAEEREAELGDLLGAVVGLARHLDVDPDAALRTAVRRFRDRFEAVLRRAAARDLDPAELDRDAWLALWHEAKAAGL